MSLKSTVRALADLLWPPRCSACSARIFRKETAATNAFCELCEQTLVYIDDPRCPKCGMPFEGSGDSHLCLDCAKEPPPFERARAMFHYGGAVAEAIQRFKYGPVPELARPLGKLVEQLVDHGTSVDAVVPVPLHAKKLRARGFNQSSLMARYVADRLDVPLCPGFLVRTRETKSQAGLTRSERLENIKGAFKVPRSTRLDDLKVLLVDDVITSAATVAEASRALLDAGARSVEVVALARATGSSALLASEAQKS